MRGLFRGRTGVFEYERAPPFYKEDAPFHTSRPSFVGMNLGTVLYVAMNRMKAEHHMSEDRAQGRFIFDLS